ncbi:MAG: hypothetical protein J5861_05420 [Desulfovibrio sp.]|nr:hypothetical protein [Desulfovibrio sp.]
MTTQVLSTVNARGVPIFALLVSSGATLICVLPNYFMPGKALVLLMALVVVTLVINWAMISLTHLKFRAARMRAAIELSFKAFWYPWSNYLSLFVMVGILAVLVKNGE